MYGRFSRVMLVLLCFIFITLLSPAAFAENEATPVTVVFSCEDERALPGLHVFDQAGVEYAPLTDADSGEVQYGNFLLMPGDYSYSFHNEEGRYEDFSAFFTVEEAIKYIIPIDLTPVIHIESFSFTYIDPIYEGIITEADIPEISSEQRAAAENELRELATVQANNPSRLRAKYFWDSTIYYDNIEDAAMDLRAQVKQFESDATVRFKASSSMTESQLASYFMDIWYKAIEHTGNPTEGDYLRYEHGGTNVNFYKLPESVDGNGYCYNVVQMTLNHFTNAEQEAALSDAVDSILAQLTLGGKSDLQKILSIYDYLCANVTYDKVSDEDLKRTAYAALINHSAVCQGYAAAFYRLCLSVDVDTRIITSKSMGHAWNIVALGGQYYELDSTWDSDANRTLENYKYFLKGSDYWLSSNRKHLTIGDQFDTASFAAAYPLSVDSVPIFRFNSDGGSTVLPQYVLSGDQADMPVSPTKDGYWFTGWYADSGFTTLFDFDSAVTADTTVYAQWSVPDFVLPSALSEIGAEAFSGGAFTFAVLPENAVTVGPLAFAGCPELSYIYIPASIEEIDSTAFEGVTVLTILGPPSAFPSTAETYAVSHGYAFVPISKESID